MDNNTLAGFRDVVLGDTGLQEQLRSAASEPDFVATVVALGRDRGFEFTAEEVKAQMASSIGKSGELSEADLEQVAGGYTSYGDSLSCGYCKYSTSDDGTRFKVAK